MGVGYSSITISKIEDGVSGAPFNWNLLLGTGTPQYITLGGSTEDYYTEYYEETEYGKAYSNDNTEDFFSVGFDWEYAGSGAIATLEIDGDPITNIVSAKGYYQNDMSKIMLSGSSGHYEATFKLTAKQAAKASQRMRVRVYNNATIAYNEKNGIFEGFVIDTDGFVIIPNDSGITYVDYIYNIPPAPTGSMTVKNFKFETGDKPSLWCPAVDEIYGTGVVNIREYYALSADGDNAPADNLFTENVQTPTLTSKYLWNYEIIIYSDGTQQKMSKHVAGVYGDTGNGISRIEEYYQISADNENPPTNWVTTPPITKIETPYLWNYEVIVYTNGSQVESEKRVIGTHGEKGDQGKSLVSITDYYARNNSTTAPADSSFSTSVTSPTSSNKYVWNYELMTWDDNGTSSTTKTTKHIVAVYGDKGGKGDTGKSLTNITDYYAVNNSTTAPADSSFDTTVKSPTASNRYLWIYEVLTWDDNGTSSTTRTDKHIAAVYGEKGEKGDTPTVTSTVTEYQQSASGTTVPTGTWESSPPTATAGQFMWARITVTYDTGDTAVSYAVAKNGTNGTSATTYRLIVTASAIKKNASGVYDPTAITLTGKAQTGSDSMANYSGRFIIETTTNNSTWTAKYTSSTNETTTTYTIPANVVAVRCSLYKAGGTTQLLDQQTIPVVTDGSDAYTVLLTNESHSFAGGTAAAVGGSVNCGVIAYKGATQVAPTIGTITGMPSGMTVAISNNSTTSAKFTVTVTSSMTTPSGTLTVPVTVDGKSFTKNFSYSLSRKGDSPVVTASKSGGTTTISVDGVTQATIYDGATYNFIVSHAAINRGADGSFNPTAISLQAQKLGENSAPTAYAGRFTIEVTDNYFWYPLYTSTSDESSKTYTLPSGDFTVLLADYDGTALTDYDGNAPTGLIGRDEVCAFRVTLYAAGGTTTLLNQQIIPVTSDGIGVVSMTTQYYLSTSASEPVGGSWSDTNPAYVDGRTYWTREKTVWTNGETTYSDPVKDQGLTDSCANALAASIAAENAMTAANGKNKVIHANKPSTWPTTGYSDGDTWFAKDEGYKMYTFSNGAWVAEQLNTQAIAANAIKASNIDAGAITADKIAANAIDTKQITLGGSSHDGKITMMSASNKVLAVWDKTGLTMYDGTGTTALSEDVIGSWTASGIDIKKGTIAGATINGATINGGTLTLGGSSSGTGRSGSIAMYNSSNKLIGTWDSSGLTMYDGNGASLGSWTSSGIIVNEGTITASAVSGGTLDFDPTNFEVENFSADLITAGTLVVGGSSNTSGADQIIVKNSQDQTIGTWGASGISVYGASITGGVIKTTDTQHAMFDYHVDTYEIDNARTSPTADRYMHIAGGSISSVLAGTDPSSSASNIKGQIYPVSIIRKRGTSTIDTLDGWYVNDVLYAPTVITAGGIVPGRDDVSGMITTFLSAYSTTTAMNTAISNSATAVMNWVGEQGYITDGIDASDARTIARNVADYSTFQYLNNSVGYSDEQTGCRVYYHNGLPIATMIFSFGSYTYKNSSQITNTTGPSITSTNAFLPAAENVYFYTNQGLLRLSSGGVLTAATNTTIAANSTIRGSVTYLTKCSRSYKYIDAPSS